MKVPNSPHASPSRKRGIEEAVSPKDDPAPPPKHPAGPHPAITRLQHLPVEMLDQVFMRLDARNRVTLGLALSSPSDTSAPVHPPPLQLAAAQLARAIETAQNLSNAVAALAPQLSAIHPVFRHVPLVAALQRMARTVHLIPQPQLQALLAQVGALAATLPERTRAAVERMVRAIDPAHLQALTTFEQLYGHARDVASLPLQPIRQHGLMAALARVYQLAQAGSDMDAVQRALSACIQPGRGNGLLSRPPGWAQAVLLQHATALTLQWLGGVVPPTDPAQFIAELFLAAAALPPEVRHLARLDHGQHILLEIWFDAEQPARRVAFFQRLLDTLPPNESRDDALGDLINVLPFLPAETVAQRFSELLGHVAQLTAAHDVETPLLILASQDSFQAIPEAQRAACLQELIQVLQAQAEQGSLSPESVEDICAQITIEALPELPDEQQPALDALVQETLVHFADNPASDTASDASDVADVADVGDA